MTAGTGSRTYFVLFSSVIVLLLFNNYHVRADTPDKIDIDITTHLGDIKNFLDGDEVSFLISINRDAHLLVLYQNARNEIIQLLPGKDRKNYFIKAGVFIPLPEPEAPFVFNIQAPFGKETLWVFAADVPLPELKGRYLESGLKKLRGKLSSIKQTLRAHPKQAYGEAKLRLHTRARK